MKRFLTQHILLYMALSWALTFFSFRVCSHKPIHIVASLAVSMPSSFLWFYGLWRKLFLPHKKLIIPAAIGKASWRHQATVSLVLVVTFASAITMMGGSQHDHAAYQQQWQTILNGQDPWLNTSNTYFPVHNLFALFFALNPLLPKLLFALLFVFATFLSSYWMQGQGAREGNYSPKGLLFFLHTALSPYALIIIYWYGLNDAVAASFMLLAVIAVSSEKQIRFSGLMSGAFLAIATATKLYPIILFPFIVFQNRRPRWDFLVGYGSSLLLVFGMAYFIWGDSMLIPFNIASGRVATFLSPFNALKQQGIDLTGFSSVSSLLALIICFAWYIWRNSDPPSSGLIGLGVFLFFYRVGHTQFLAYVFVVMPYLVQRWSILYDPKSASSLALGLFTWLGFLNWYTLQYSLNCQMTFDTPARFFRDHGGWGYALVLLFSLTTMIRILSSPPKRDNLAVRNCANSR